MSETISSGITLTIPTLGQVNWDQILKTQCFVPLSSHDHTGSGKGVQLGTSALQDDAVDDTKVKLRNNQWLRGRNAANSADVNIIRVNTSNQIEFTAGSIAGSSLAANSVDDTIIRLRNAQNLRARNAANNADLSLLGADSSNNTVIGSASGATIDLYNNGVLRFRVNGSGNLLSNVAAGVIGNLANNAGMSFYGGADSNAAGIDAYGDSHSVYPGRVNVYTGATNGIISLIARGAAGSIVFSTQGTARHVITSAGHIVPVSANGYDIGASATPFRDIHANSFRLNNGSDLFILNDANANILFYTNGSQKWRVQGDGHFVPATAGVYNLGTGANRVETLFVNGIDCFSTILTLGAVEGSSFVGVSGDPNFYNGTQRWTFGNGITLTNVTVSGTALGSYAGYVTVTQGASSYKLPLYN